MNRSGQGWETRAARFLERAGLALAERNFRCRFGEIDLVMEDGQALVFVEVRFRSDERFGGARASVGPAKQRRLLGAARCYLARHPGQAQRPCRFDVLLISGREDPNYEWIRNAFDDTPA